jgi:hypothetical protein
MEAQQSEDDENKSERGAESREQTDRPPPWKLRDLRPEKDPMGAGKETAPPPGGAEK